MIHRMRKNALLALCLFISLVSSVIGLILILMPQEDWILWPQQWLLGTPFTDLRLPGLLLLALVGATNGWAALNLINEHPRQYYRSMLGGYCLTTWIIVELLQSRELYLIHVSAVLLGILQILLAYQQKRKWAV
ncbi:MAG: hypothetical protein FJX92_04065 [Bacteroidetes bacterium]|nr:hypothetical protein [Bacteroidota bacterium]